MPSGVTHMLFVHLGIILILVLGFYSGLSGRVRTVYLFSLCVVLLFSSMITASIFFLIFLSIWYSTFLFYSALCSFVDLHGSCGCLCIKVRSAWIGESVVPHS
jgi:hypothetical protein